MGAASGVAESVTREHHHHLWRGQEERVQLREAQQVSEEESRRTSSSPGSCSGRGIRSSHEEEEEMKRESSSSSLPWGAQPEEEPTETSANPPRRKVQKQGMKNRPCRFWPGQCVDARDTVAKWAEAEVVAVDEANGRVLVTYTYWSDRWDEWLDFESERLAERGAHTYSGVGRPSAGQRVEALDERRRWLEAEVLETRPDACYVHYKNYHKKFDEWIDFNRLRAFGPHRKKVVLKKPLAAKIADRRRAEVGERSSPPPQPVASGDGPGETGVNAATAKKRTPLATVGASDANRSCRGGDSGGAHNTRGVENDDDDDDEENRARGRRVSDERRDSASSLQRREKRQQQLLEGYAFERYARSLEKRGLRLVRVAGDGNCLFRSVAFLIYGDDSHHETVRAACVEYMRLERAYFEPYVAANFEAYLADKAAVGAWGDEPELQALCELYDRPAQVWSYDADRRAAVVLRDLGLGPAATPPMRLSYYGGGHYDAVVSARSYFHHQSHSSSGAETGFPVQPGPLIGALEHAALARARARRDARSSDACSRAEQFKASQSLSPESGDGAHAPLSRALLNSDADATDATTLEAALAASRRLFDARDLDLESALRASLAHRATCDDSVLGSSFSGTGLVRDDAGTTAESSLLPPRKKQLDDDRGDTNVGVEDDDILQASLDARAVAAAEQADLDAALAASTRDTLAQPDDAENLRRTLQASRFDAQHADDAQLAAALQSSVYEAVPDFDDADLAAAIAASLDQQ